MKNGNDFTLRDLLYLDFEKAASIWSQFEEGLLESVSVTEDTGKDRSAGTKFGIPGVAEANLGVDYIQKRSTLQSKTLHHDVLTRVEKRLDESGLVTDLSSVPTDESSAETIRAALDDRSYVRAEGWGVIDDYRRILAICRRPSVFAEGEPPIELVVPDSSIPLVFYGKIRTSLTAL